MSINNGLKPCIDSFIRARDLLKIMLFFCGRD